MKSKDAAHWMQCQLEEHGCLYQDDVVDYIINCNGESLLRENADGNLVLGSALLNEFSKLNRETVVWVRPDRYWRFRVVEDENGRDARG